MISIALLFLAASNALSATYYNIDFSIPTNTVITPYFIDNAVTAAKIPDNTVTVNLLEPDPGDFPNVGDVLRWSTITNYFYFSPDLTRVGPGGGIVSLTMGKGFKQQGVSLPNPPQSGLVVLEVNKGTKGSGAITKIPYLNNDQIIFDKPASIVFNGSPTDYSFFNNNKFVLQNHSTGWPLISIDSNGPIDFGDQLHVSGKNACLSNGLGCPAQSFITNLIVNAPLTGGGNSGTVNIGANTGVNPGQLVLLGASATTPTLGALPAVNGSNLSGVVSRINSSPTIGASTLLGNVTLSAIFGMGGIQSWETHLTALGNLNPNVNDVIMGNGFSFYTVGGTTMQSNIGLLPGRDVQVYSEGLTSIGPITPASNTYLGGSGVDWEAKTIPNCSTGYFVQVNNTVSGFNCSSSSTIFSAGTFISNNQEGFRVALNGGALSEIHFYGTNSNYVGFKSASTPSTNTIWTFPSSDGSNGQFLTTNSLGLLSFVTNYNGDVTGPASSSSTYAPLFSDTTGKILKNQTTLMVDTTNSRVGIGTSTPTNLLTVSSGANQQGIEVGPSFLGSCTGTNFGCFTNTALKNSTTGYSILQESTGQTDLNAASTKSISFKINDVVKATLDQNGNLGIGTTTPSKPLQVSGAGGENGAILGNAFVGETVTYGNNYASFLNSANGDTSYALLQSNAGSTFLNAATGKYIGFRVNNADMMRLTSAGNLGIGTTAPGEQLTIDNGNLRLENQDSPKLIIKGNGIADPNSGQIEFFETNEQFGWYIRHNSNNGGGSDQDSLQFFRLRGGVLTEEFRMAKYGKLFANVTAIGNLSDRTIKKDISDFKESASILINKFRPVNFSWKSSPDQEHIGLIAQEVEKIEPRFVMTNPILKKLMVKYDEILPLMIANLKELQIRNENLKLLVSREDNQKIQQKINEIKKINKLLKEELNRR